MYIANEKCKYGTYKIPDMGLILRHCFPYQTLIEFDMDDLNIDKIDDVPRYDPICFSGIINLERNERKTICLNSVPDNFFHRLHFQINDGSFKILISTNLNSLPILLHDKIDFEISNDRGLTKAITCIGNSDVKNSIKIDILLCGLSRS